MEGLELCDAVVNNELQQVKLLVQQHNIDLNDRFKQVREERQKGMFPIHLAAYHGHHGMLHYFMESGCDISITTIAFRRTALHITVTNRQLPCMMLLIGAGAQLDAKDTFGNTPCHYAAENGSCHILDVLIRNGVDVNTQDITSKTPLMKAVRSHRIDAVVRLLLAQADSDITDRNGDTALHLAARSGYHDVIDILLSSGSLINVQNSFGRTPLMESVCNNYTRSVARLLNANCDLDCQDFKTGDTALHTAIKKDDVHLALVLLENGTRYNVYNHQGETAFFDAVVKNKTDILQLMIRFNCELDVPPKCFPDGSHKSMFQLAAEKGHLRTCGLLAELGYIDCTARMLFRGSEELSIPTEALTWLQEVTQQVISLRQLCRKVIRRRTSGHDLTAKVESMPVPRALKDYILLKNVDNVYNTT